MLKYLGHLYVFDVDEGEIEKAQFLHAILSRAHGDYSIDWLMMQVCSIHYIYHIFFSRSAWKVLVEWNVAARRQY